MASTDRTQAQKNADRVKKFRLAKIASIGQAEFIRIETENREKRRARQKVKQQAIEEKKDENKQEPIQPKVRKPRTTKPKPVTDESECKKRLLERIFQLKTDYYNTMSPPKSIKKTTVEIQLTKIYNLHKNITGKTTCADFTFIKDKKTVLDFIDKNYNTDKSRNAQIEAIASILQVLGDDNLYNFYSQESTRRNSAITAKADENVMTESERINLLKWTEIKKIFKKITDPLHRAVASLYILIPPRRSLDYAIMKVIDNESDLKDDYNYLVVDENKKPIKLIFNQYKTVNTYGQQIVKVPKRLSDILKTYLTTFKVKIGVPLFATQSGTYYKSLSEIVTNVFAPYANNKRITINGLRHSYISAIISKNPSLAIKKKVAKAMATSVSMFDQYNRIDL